METGWEERLWMGHDSFHYPTMAPGKTDRHTVEYVRADVHQSEIATLKAEVERLTKERDQAIEAGAMRIGPDNEILMTPVTVLESEDCPDLFVLLKARGEV